MVKYATRKVNQQITCREVTPIIWKKKKKKKNPPEKDNSHQQVDEFSIIPLQQSSYDMYHPTRYKKNVNFTNRRQVYGSLGLSE